VAIPSTGQVIVLDLRDFRVLAEIQVGRLPSKIILAQEGRIAFVNCVGEGVIVGIDMRRFTVVGSFKVGGGEDSGPVQFTATQAGFPVRTANQGNATASAALSATRINDVRLDFKPAAVASDADGKRAFLVGPDADGLAMVEAEAAEARMFRMIAPAGGYKSVAATSDAELVAVVHPMKQAASFYRGGDMQLRAILDNLKTPSRVVITDDGGFFCILDPGANSISLVEVSSIA
jgi:DNA-binding beta-propeller fold protein YncE